MRSVFNACVTALSVCFATTALAGDLNPPAGPVAPSMKTLDEVEPSTPINDENTPGDANSMFRITASGAYHLTENMIVLNSEVGIEIAVPGVTIDLGGFTVAGNPAVSGVDFGIRTINTTIANTVVRDGRVVGFGRSGLSLGERSLVEDVHAEFCDDTGIIVGRESIVRSCTVSSCGAGVIASTSGIIERTVATGNESDGIRVADGVRVIDCTASENGGNGFDSTSFGSSFEGCVARDNTLDGFDVFRRSSLAACTATGNGVNGIDVGAQSSVIGCTSNDNGVNGITADEGVSIVDCVTSLNQQRGIDAREAATIRGCSAFDNGNVGIDALDGSTVVGCTVRGNGIGIEIADDCTVRNNTVSSNTIGIRAQAENAIIGNTASDNSQSNITVFGNGNRIDSNTLSGSERSFDIFGFLNLVVRNSSRGASIANYRFDNINDNDVGTIQSSPVGAGPWDNFEF